MSYRHASAEDEAVGAYVVEPLEYVRNDPLPANDLFEDLDQVSDLMAQAMRSIEERTPQQMDRIISQLQDDRDDQLGG